MDPFVRERLERTLDVLATHEEVEVLRWALNTSVVRERERSANQRRHVGAVKRSQDVAIEPARVASRRVPIDLTRRSGVWLMRHGTLVEEERQPYARPLCKTRAS